MDRKVFLEGNDTVSAEPRLPRGSCALLLLPGALFAAKPRGSALPDVVPSSVPEFGIKVAKD